MTHFHEVKGSRCVRFYWVFFLFSLVVFKSHYTVSQFHNSSVVPTGRRARGRKTGIRHPPNYIWTNATEENMRAQHSSAHTQTTSVCQEVPIMRFFGIWRSLTPLAPPPAARLRRLTAKRRDYGRLFPPRLSKGPFVLHVSFCGSDPSVFWEGSREGDGVGGVRSWEAWE